jgi:iron complex transport system permease protein
MMAKKKSISFLVLGALLLGLFYLAVNTGSIQVSPAELFRGIFLQYDEQVAVIWDLRFPRIIIAVLAGSAMAVSGALFQAVMKNPLADPGIIGISSGASFTALIITLFFPSLFFLGPFFAFLGGLASFVLIYSLAWRSHLNPLRLILVGVAVNAVFSGLIQSLDYLSAGSQTAAAAIVNANITMKTWEDVKLLGVYTVIGLLASLLVPKQCNLFLLEDKTVRNLGVNIERLRVAVSLVAVLLASITTAVAGVIGFVGLIGPHLARLFVGSDHRALIPFSILMGGFIVLLADTLGRTILYPYEIPAAIVMMVVGGPFFIFLLLRSGKYYGN